MLSKGSGALLNWVVGEIVDCCPCPGLLLAVVVVLLLMVLLAEVVAAVVVVAVGRAAAGLLWIENDESN